MALDWKGDAVLAKAERAAVLAVNATMAAAIIHAKQGHGSGAHGDSRFISRSSDLERSFRISQPARPQGRFVVGRWGSIGIIYARRIELGFQGKDKLGRSFNQPAYPALRPAAIAEYPKLHGRVRRAFASA